MTTWAGVHVGDTVRGADARDWLVVERGPASTWLGSGVSDAVFRLRLGAEPDAREVAALRALHEPAPVLALADHTAEAAAFAALLTAGFNPEFLEETIMQQPAYVPSIEGGLIPALNIGPAVTPPATPPADQFSSPAAPVKRDRFGRYLLPDPETGVERAWTRVSTVARTLADEYNLTLWKLRMVAKGLALRPDLIAGAAAADPDADKRTLDEIAAKAMERAGSSSGATLGTALHSFTQRLDQGETLASLGAPAPLDRDVVAYADTLKAHRLTVLPQYIERIVVLPELGVAGMFDRVLMQPAGVTRSQPLSVLDLKTGKDLSYGWLEIAIQQAFYARASLIWNPTTGSYEPMPAVDLDRALVLHLPVGKAHGQLYGVNIIEGWEYAQLAMQVRKARSGAKGLAWLVDPEPADLAIHRVSKAAGQAELAQLWDQLHPKGLWTPEVNAAAAQRWTELQTTAA